MFCKDCLVFCWSYYQFGSRYVYDEKWFILRLIQKEVDGEVYKSTNLKATNCSFINENLEEDVKKMCVPSLLFFYLGYFSALWSRLAEIGIRTTFIVFTSISALLFEALEERIEEIAKKTATDGEYTEQDMSMELDELRSHYDLVCQLVEQINRAFGFVLLVISGHDFAIAIMDFNNILDYLDIGKVWHTAYEGHFTPVFHMSHEKYKSIDFFFDPLFEKKYVFLRSNPFKTCQFAYSIFRFLLLLVVSHRVGSKVHYRMLLYYSLSF